MSEQIEITILTEKKDFRTKDIRENKVTHEIGATLMSTLLKNKLISGNFCGGRGTCGRCRVQFLQGAPIPVSVERRIFSADELRAGYRLACMARPKNGCVIRLDVVENRPIDIVTDVIDVSPSIDFSSQVASYVIAVDLGTTTIAMQLMDVRTGQAVDTYCAMNPQRSYGTDVLSRIQAANAGNEQVLRSSVWEVLRRGVRQFRGTIGSADADIACMCIAGNTAMEHILMGLSTENLGKSPFSPVTLDLQVCDFPFMDNHTDAALAGEGLLGAGIKVYIMPGISAFVGGDIVAGLYDCHLLPGLCAEKEERAAQEESVKNGERNGAALLIDLGTNGEMAVTDGRRMIVTAAAAGPAFEGGAGASVPGSDMVALTAGLLKKGIIDETGLLAEPYFEEGINVCPPGKTETVHLTQKDIRDLQMAKAAVRAGVETLREKMGDPRITDVFLAGGFGYYLDVGAAAAIGLLPEDLRQCTRAVGNTSLAGAYAIGRDLCAGRINAEVLTESLRSIESINLAETEGFERRYVDCLNFPSTE